MSFCKHRVMDKCKKDGKLCIYTKECFEPEEPKPQTNADHIRSMTDEELAELLFEMQDIEYGHEGQPLDWLKQPYGGDV